VGIKNAKELVEEKYPDLMKKKRISKEKFLKLLKLEYEINGYSTAV